VGKMAFTVNFEITAIVFMQFEISIGYDDDDVYLNKLQREVLQNLWSEYMNNADQAIWHKERK
jgi:hypothetical protein